MHPHERGLIAAVLCDPTTLDRVATTGRQFIDQDLGQLLDAVRLLHESGTPVGDVAAVLPALNAMRLPKSVTSAQFIAGLLAEPFEVNHADYYAKEITARHAVVELQRILDTAATRLSGTQEPNASDVSRWLQAQLSSHDITPQAKPQHVKEIYNEIVSDLAKPHEDQSIGIMTGIERHDEMLGGWQPGELVILAARPGCGKTSLGQQIAWLHATKGRCVGFVSLEMTGRELGQRIVSSETGIDSACIRTRQLDQKNLLDIEAIDWKFDVPLMIWSPPRATVHEIRAFTRRQHAAQPLSLLVVDYIGLVRPTDPRRPRHEQVSDVTASLKAIAKEIGIPVLALCQLNREAEGNIPRLSNLRESGSIEQDADSVIFLHPEHNREGHYLHTLLIVAKNRHGKTGTVKLAFNAKLTRFSQHEPEATRMSNYDNRFEAYSQEDF